MTHKKYNAKEVAYDGIISLIMKGAVKPGERLIEQQIGDMLKISRTPVRSSMHTLASEGLLENRGTGGYLVPQLSLKDLNELYTTRFMLEPCIAELAARNTSDKKKEYFTNILNTEREYYLNGRSDMYKLNVKLHRGIASLANNKYMAQLLDRIFWRHELYILFFDTFYHAFPGLPLIRDPELSDSYSQHIDLVNAIFSHDPKQARMTMEVHLRGTWNMLKRNIFASKEGLGGGLISDWDVKMIDL